jgi:nucleotide-binding universal stress UspA family protein
MDQTGMSTASELSARVFKLAPQAGLRVLVPLDETPQARRVLEYAQALVADTGGVLKLVRASGVEADAGNDSLAYPAERLREARLTVESTVVANEDAVTTILQAARAWQPDLIAMATNKRSALDRWLNGSVTDEVVRSAEVPVLVVPPAWERTLRPGRALRILVPLDGSRLSEQALPVALRLADVFSMRLVLLRATPRDEADAYGAREYMRRISEQVESALAGGEVTARVVTAEPATAILAAARDFDVDGIVMSTRGHTGLGRAVLGSTAIATLEQANVPLIVLGPNALREATTAQIPIRAPVRTLDDELVGEVHRVVINLEQRAIVSVVVLGRGPLARDVLVPVDFIEALDKDQLLLRLTRDELDELPGFTLSEYVTPPPTWTLLVPRIIGPAWLAVSERKRLGAHQQDITPGSRVLGVDGDLGPVDRVEVGRTGRIEAFWVRGGDLFATDMRIPVEWIQETDVQGNLRIDATRADIETYLGHESGVRLGGPPPLP